MGAHPHDSPAGPAGGRLGADLAARVEAIVHAAEREARVAEQAIAAHRRSAEEEVRRYLAAATLHADAESAARAARVETLSAAARRLADELADAVAALNRELHADPETTADRIPAPPWPPAAAAPEPPEPPASAAPEPPGHPAPPPATPPPSWSRLEGTGAAAQQPAAAHADRAGGGEDARPPAGRPVGAPGWAEPDQTGPARQAAGAADAESDANANGAGAVPSAARLVAIEMAVGGSSRAEVERHLRDTLGVAEPDPLLDDVFGVASHAGSRLAWGEP